MIAVDCDGGCRDVYEDLFYAPEDATEAIGNSEWRTDGEHHWCPECQEAPHDHAPDPQDQWTCARCGDTIVEEM